MPGQGLVSDWTECSSSAEPPAVARTEGGGGGSPGHSYYQNSKDGIKDGHKVNSHVVKLQELRKTPQIQTIHIPKSMTDASFLKIKACKPSSVFQHPDFTMGQKRYLCSIAKIYNANYLRTLMKRQYMHMVEHSSPKPGVLTHHRSRLSSHYSQKHHYPCTTWRHQLEREDSGPSQVVAAAVPEMIIQHSLWRPVRNKEGPVSYCLKGGKCTPILFESLKPGYVSKTRCKSLKIFRKPGRLFIQSVSTNDSESYMNEEKKEEDLLNKCMQSMSIEEGGEEHLMLT
ncbi:PREDICTED: protein FAM216A isoform X2 [Hipposideros armiger]|uniref:Protein FAM216A isoform X2 n=1 Tax=Hipposideros armiger TaxID=186990 RepID=A0A8B7RVY4_HIPAR|nr:PREDICTED: protein FAM216A isoform X2 [Hipposideros armiger]